MFTFTAEENIQKMRAGPTSRGAWYASEAELHFTCQGNLGLMELRQRSQTVQCGGLQFLLA